MQENISGCFFLNTVYMYTLCAEKVTMSAGKKQRHEKVQKQQKLHIYTTVVTVDNSIATAIRSWPASC